MIQDPSDVQGRGAASASAIARSRASRLLAGWSANFFQMVLGITQQIALVPVFLHFWSGEMLAAWLVIYAVGSLVLVADSGLQFRTINRFLALKSSVDRDGRTASFYAGMRRIYFGLAAGLLIALLAATQLVAPSTVLGFQAIADFDVSFVVVAAGMLLVLPSALVSGLYRAHGLYGRVVGLQGWATLIGQLGQLLAIATSGSLLAVTTAYVGVQVALSAYLLFVDAPRLFPFLRGARAAHSWSWIFGQFRNAMPFGVAGATELALVNLPVLLVSAFVSDRVAIAQWGLTRVVAGLLRAFCTQATLPLAAELGHDHATGSDDRLRSLYARGSVLVTLLASVAVSGLLPFWPDFFALWTRGAVAYDPLLTMTLMLGTAVISPSILAFTYASYSNRGPLLVRSKGLQLMVFLILSVVLIRWLGPLGAAIAIVASDLLVQCGLLGSIVIQQTLQRPLWHIAFLAAVMTSVMLGGWGLGAVIRSWVPGSGLGKFAVECTIWILAVALAAAPLVNQSLRNRLIAAIPR